MSKIAREISKKASVVTLAAVLAVQSIPVNAAEIESVNNLAVETNLVAEDKQDLEAKVEKAVPAVEVKEDAKAVEKAEAEESKVINIPDKDVEKAIRDRLKLPEDKKITQEDMENLTYIYVKGNPKTLEGLEYAVNLTRIDIFDATKIENMSALKSLQKIINIHVINGSFDLNNVSHLKDLTYLYLAEVPNENLDALVSDKMTDVIIFEAKNMRDISALSKMKDLEILVLEGGEDKKSPLEDISPLVNLKNIKKLNLSNTSVSDFNTLVNLNKYTYLLLDNCNISDISGLPQFQEMCEESDVLISVNNNKIADPTPIFTTKYWGQAYANQTVVLPEIVTEGGNVVYKIPYGEFVTDVEIDENVGKYNPETKEITFYNISSNTDVTYKVRAHNGLDGTNKKDLFGMAEWPRYDYSATITQPIRIPGTEPVVKPEPVIKPEPVVEADKPVPTTNTSQTTSVSTVNKVSKDSPKTGDAGEFGVLSLAVMSLAGAVKSRKRK